METEAKAALKQLVYLLRNNLGANIKGYALMVSVLSRAA